MLAPVESGLLIFNLGKKSWTVEGANNAFEYPPAEDGSEVWTGREVLSFGGDGCTIAALPCPFAQAIDPSTGIVSNLSVKGAPAFRADATTVWTGARMIIWGGSANQSNGETIQYADGALYDPVANAWTPMSQAPGPKPAYTWNAAVWTGTNMLVWGGAQQPAGSRFVDATDAAAGLAYDPSSNTWTTLPTEGQPSSRGGHVAVWTGTEMLIWGGAAMVLRGLGQLDTTHPLSDGAAYNPATKTWRPVVAPNSGLLGPASAWTGTEMLVWGGYDDYRCGGGEDCPGSNLGYRYNPATDVWSYITTVNAPSPRVGMGAVWTGKSLIIWGGDQAGLTATDGAQWVP